MLVALILTFLVCFGFFTIALPLDGAARAAYWWKLVAK